MTSMTGPFLKIRNFRFFWASTIPNFWTDRVYNLKLLTTSWCHVKDHHMIFSTVLNKAINLNLYHINKELHQIKHSK